MAQFTFGPSGQDPRAELAAVGPVIEVVIDGPFGTGPAIRARGLIDTGASVVVIDRRIALQLGLKPIDQDQVAVAGGATFSSTIYMGRLNVPELGYSELTQLYAAPMRQATHNVLLGRDFLRHFIMTFNGPEGLFHFFRPPSAEAAGFDDDFATQGSGKEKAPRPEPERFSSRSGG